MKYYLKFGGLLLSSALTISLFIRLFGFGPYGIFVALAALALFEGGAVAWAHVLGEAKQGQRSVAKLGQWYCVMASVASSGAEIILSTNLWEAGFDVGFVTLLIIIGALGVNVLGAVAFDQLDPRTAERNRELDRSAKSKREAERLEERVIDQSLIKAEGKVNEIAGRVSDELAAEIRGDVLHYLLAQTRGGKNSRTLPAPTRAPDQNALDEVAQYFSQYDEPDKETVKRNGHSSPK